MTKKVTEASLPNKYCTNTVAWYKQLLCVCFFVFGLFVFNQIAHCFHTLVTAMHAQKFSVSALSDSENH